MMTMIEVEPQPRIDTLVRLAAGGESRRTEYTGTAWFDGKPVMSGLTLQRSPVAPRGIRMPNFQASFFVPDSLRYTRAALGAATLSVSVVLQASGERARSSTPPRPSPTTRRVPRPGFRCTSAATWAGLRALATGSSR
jgi:hypothetical protein